MILVVVGLAYRCAGKLTCVLRGHSLLTSKGNAMNTYVDRGRLIYWVSRPCFQLNPFTVSTHQHLGTTVQKEFVTPEAKGHLIVWRGRKQSCATSTRVLGCVLLRVYRSVCSSVRERQNQQGVMGQLETTVIEDNECVTNNAGTTLSRMATPVRE